MTQNNATPQDDVSSSAEVFAPGPAALSDEWMRYLPEELRESFVKAQVRSRLNALNDDTPLSQDLASVYLDVSDATLKRMRASGKGPQYIQGMSEEGAKSRNQKVLYTVGSLKDWISKNRTDSTGHAAVRRGLMFQSITELMMPEPWVISEKSKIITHAFSNPNVNLKDKITWISWINLIDYEFENVKLQTYFIETMKYVHEKHLLKLNSILERNLIQASIEKSS